MILARVVLLSAMVVTAGCALPNIGVRSGSLRPTVGVHGAPTGAQLYVDGIAMGPAADFDGTTKVVKVEEGFHRVEIRLDGRVVHSESVVMSSGESRVVEVSGDRSK